MDSVVSFSFSATKASSAVTIFSTTSAVPEIVTSSVEDPCFENWTASALFSGPPASVTILLMFDPESIC